MRCRRAGLRDPDPLENEGLIGTGWDPSVSVQLPYKWLNSMVYGRYNELVGVRMVYKPTNWGPHS